MGQGDEYSRDAYSYELAYDSSDDDLNEESLHPEDWQDWHSEQLLDAWMTLQQYTEENYLIRTVTYHDFVDFVMNSDGYYHQVSEPCADVVQLWNVIKDIRVIRDLVQPESFHNWLTENLNLN